MPTLPKMFRPVTQTHLFFYLAWSEIENKGRKHPRGYKLNARQNYVAHHLFLELWY